MGDEDKEERIRAFAYRIWEEEGYPEGAAERHWEMAKRAIEAENAERVRIAVGLDSPSQTPGDSDKESAENS